MKESRKESRERTIKMKQAKLDKMRIQYLNYDIMAIEQREEKKQAYNN